MNSWTHKVETYTTEEVKEFCVNDSEWQRFRLSLKGISTQAKIRQLNIRRESNLVDSKLSRRHQVQIDNYINALKRGGQLDLNCVIVR
jgi:hypothetical protein